jgi:Flp pilus assembly pilin Flp
MSLKECLTHFLRGNRAQDLVEYSLLLAFVGIVAVSLVVGMSGSVSSIWSQSNTTLAVASGGQGTPTMSGGSNVP